MAEKKRTGKTQEKRGGYSGSAPAKLVRPTSAGATSGGSGEANGGRTGSPATDTK